MWTAANRTNYERKEPVAEFLAEAACAGGSSGLSWWRSAGTASGRYWIARFGVFPVL